MFPISRNLTRFATDYNDQTAEPDGAVEFVIPEDISGLDDTQLSALHAQAVEHFNSVYGDGANLSDEDVEVLSALTEGIEALSAEVVTRNEAAQERSAKAAELSARVQPVVVADEVVVDEVVEEVAPVVEPEVVVASAEQPRRVETRVAINKRNAAYGQPKSDPVTMKDVAFSSGDGVPNHGAGEGVDWMGVADIVERRLQGYNHGMYAAAASDGRTMSSTQQVVSFRRPISSDLVINDPNNSADVESVIARAVDEKRLTKGSLVAAGGWCAPSETLYDLVELESRDGLFDLPEIGIARGGIKRTLGPTFSDIYSSAIDFHYTEAEDIAGDYNGAAAGNGSKPCYRVGCPTFEEFRLEADGLCIQAGLLQARGYPEMIARVTRGVLTAHEHKMSARRIGTVAAGSTAVTMPAPQVGALAPILSAIEMQVEHTRYIHRLARGTTLEAVFPFWVRAVIRQDLSRRLGVDMTDVPNSRIDAWFTSRGVRAQYVYNWQDLTGLPGAMVAWPSTVKFLLYPAGTWIKGASAIITMDALYDSTLLGQNDFTALFTEEASMVVKMSHDSRIVTVSICADGSGGLGQLLACDGKKAV